ncbi:hypothetical protein DID88_007955 [Monilinia fructigena]|uniref:Uncharacterized protein n=1 Tax=Monilinia fructigena TaxID=38457 RepID=A0A395J3W2_9HELO|nr:hypothetical protein DID88_007955 [Monilinia fructigena]
MSDSKLEESSHLDPHEEYLHLKAVSDKKLQNFAQKPDDKKKLVDVSVEARERAGAILRSWKHLGQLLKACQNEARRMWLTASEETRTQTLQRIMPNIPNPRRPDLAENQAGLKIGMDRAFSNFYGAPQMQMPTDFSKLRSMFHVRHTLAMDHVWLLRINPGYLKKNIEGVLHQDDPMSQDVVRVIFKAFISLQKWECLRNLAAEAERIQKEYKKTPRDYLQAVVAPPKHYFIAVLKLFQSCGQEESEMTRQFITGLGAILKSDKVEADGIKHLEMMRLLNNLMTGNRSIHVFDFMDDLEEVAIYESSDGERISVKGRIFSSFLAHFLSDLGLIGIATYEVWKDWAEQICAATKDQKDMTFKKSLQMEETAVAIDRILFTFKDRLHELGSIADNKFNYQIEAKRSEESTKSLCNAEQALDEFWQYVDKIMLNNGFPGFLKVPGMNMALWRTPKLQAPEITTHESRVTMPARVVSANNLSATPPEIFAKDSPYVILVSDRAMKVFKAIFRAAQPSTDKTKKVHFKEFIDAMGEAGFRAIKHHMSMWYFQPEGVPLWADPALAHGIMINMPWPNQRISVKYAYELGQRLHRHYSWTLETFTENFNMNTHWIARFDAVEFLQAESVAATQEPGISFSAVVLRNKQIARFQAQEREYCNERKNRNPIWFGDSCCSEIVGPQTDNEVVGQRSEPKKRYPMLFGNWA